jgi:3-phenylpropionate/trans-cinnamate dioxygenase ferredoxin reductase subunit
VAGLESVVIIGGGLAGGSAAFGLRKAGFAGAVTLVADESFPPYERPPLSKDYLRGETELESAYVHPEPDYASNDIELRLGRRAVTIDPVRRIVNLDDGSDLRYDALVLATGAKPRQLRVRGSDLPGLHYLRAANDADAVRTASAEADAVVVVGNGWIGSEVAASLRQMGREVTMVGATPRPLERVLGPEVAQVYLDLHLEHGVRVIAGHVVGFEGKDRIEGVTLEDGTVLPASLVVAGIGAIPRLRLAQRAGLELAEGGIAVDEFLRTSVPSIYAIGDIAAAWHPRHGRHIRVEHWDNAKRQGAAVAATIAGSGAPYARTPYFYSDQFDLGMEYRGYAPRWGRVVLRGDLRGRAFDAFWLADNRVIAAMNANRWDDGKALSRLVASEVRVDPDRLADADVPIEELAGPAERAA